MTEVVFAIPGRVDKPTGGFVYDRRVMALMPSLGVSAHYLNLPGLYPNPSKNDLDKARELLNATPPAAKLVIEGLALGVMPGKILAPLGHRIIALVHQPLAEISGLNDTQRDELFIMERSALEYARSVITLSALTRDKLIQKYGIDLEKITVAEPGTDPAPRASGTGTPLQLLAVGAIEPRKKYNLLIDALIPISHLDWRLTIVGAKDRDETCVSELTIKIAKAGLGERVNLAGVVVPATLERLYDGADIFVQPSPLDLFGTALSEAMVRGLPIISGQNESSASAATLNVPFDDEAALQDALARILQNKKLRRQLADAAWDIGRKLPTWNETARRIGAVILGLDL